MAPWPTPLTTAHVAGAAALLAETYAHRAHEPERWGSGSPNDEQRWIVEARDASIAAYLALWRVQANQFRMDLIVRPSSRRTGLGARLLELLIDRAREAQAASLQARPYAESTDALSLLARHEFRETMRMVGLELNDVAAVSLPSFASRERDLTAKGLRVTTLAEELKTESRSWEKLRDANQAARFGWPDPDPRPDGKPHEPETVDEFQRRAHQFGMIGDACFIITDGNRYIGYSALTVNDEARTQAGSGGTAVRPEYRGLGIATVLKSRCARWAEAHGIRRLATCSGNPAMIRVNEKFGFRRTYVEVRLVKRLV